MIRTIALWGAEVGWRGQGKWRKALKTLQYQSLSKSVGAPYGTAQAAVDRIAGVEPIETKLDSMQARFVARSMTDPTAIRGLWPRDFKKSQEEVGKGGHWTDHEDSGWKAGLDGFEMVADRMVGRLGLDGGEEVSWGGPCSKVEVFTYDVDNKRMGKEQWEERVKEITMGGGYDVAFTDGSKLDNGDTGAGWTVRNCYEHELCS